MEMTDDLRVHRTLVEDRRVSVQVSESAGIISWWSHL
jgi:hypothetical protein